MIMMSQSFQKELQEVANNNQLMGLSVIVKKDRVRKSDHLINEFYFGLRNLENNLPVNSDTKFRVASISKIFTGLGLMKLESQKKVNLEKDISTYLGYKVFNPNFPEEKITIKMLLTHTTSLNDGTGYDNFLSATYNNEIIPNINNCFLKEGQFFTDDMWLNKKPSTYFNYCNLNYGIIGTIIEKVSRKRFDVFMKEEILKPLGIESSFNIQDFESVENIATLYRFQNELWTATKDDFKGKKPVASDLSNYVLGTNGSYFGPQGGLRLSARDLIIVLDFLKTDGKSKQNVIPSKTIQKMKKVQWQYNGTNGDSYLDFYLKWALGLHIVNTSEKDQIHDVSKYGQFIGHGGDAYGLISDAFYAEKKDLSIVIIMNGTKNLQKGKGSFYKFEEDIFKLIQKHFFL